MPQPDPSPSGGDPTRQPHVLLVDDDSSILAVSGILLKRLGYRVSPFAHPRQALAACRDLSQHYDLILTDYTLPEMNGILLAQAVQTLRPGAKAVVMSGGGEMWSEADARLAGVVERLDKPFSVTELSALLKRVCPSAAAAP